MNDLKELYNALILIKSKSKDLGVCHGECKLCTSCTNPLCNKIGAYRDDRKRKYAPSLYDSICKPNFESFGVLTDFCQKQVDCSFCILDDRECGCLARNTPFTDFQILAEKVRSEINA